MNLQELLQALNPVKTKHPLIRVGGNNDGGYLLPDDLSGIAVCFSPGVGPVASFEKDLLTRNIQSHVADASVNSMPENVPVLSFEKKFLGSVNNDNTMTLEFWVKNKENNNKDLLLQMDIDDGEYDTIIAAPIDILRRFRIIALEVHRIESWKSNTIMEIIVKAFFDKLLSNFHVVHLHPNNCSPLVNVEGILLPDTFEITLLRKDRSPPEGYCSEFPHPLDQPNTTYNKDFALPEVMYKTI